jgi:hypothetical protein
MHNAAQPLHAGLIILIPVVDRALQRKLFRAALDELTVIGEPVNRVREVDLEGRGSHPRALRFAPIVAPICFARAAEFLHGETAIPGTIR